MDRKLIAQWQGHQDGGQLILDTYTQVFGSDDEEYVRGQLAKLGGGMAIAPSGSDVDGSTSGAMKGPKKSHALPPAPADPVPPPAPAATVNPYTKGHKVRTKLGGKGNEVQAEVVAVYKDEVQVRTPDGELRWRTIRTVEPTEVVQVAPEPAQTESVTRRRGKWMKQKRR